MYNIIKSVISAGNYKLTDIQNKIKGFYVRGNLTEAEMNDLLSLAALGVSPDAERPEYLTLIQHLAKAIERLENRLMILEGDNPENSMEFPLWKPWDGISTDYQCGAIVCHNGELWTSVFDGQNVWEPGVSENLWQKYDA